MPEVVFTLSKAKVALYLLDSAGEPITSAAVWSGAEAEGIRLIKSFEQRITKASGIKYPRVRTINEVHQIEIERLWVTRHDDSTPEVEADFEPGRTSRYALALSWAEQFTKDQSDDRWFSRLYYGVTVNGHDLTSRDIFELGSSQKFQAEFYKEKHGKGVVPAA